MGAHDIWTSWPGTLTEKEVTKKFAALLDDDRYEHGHEGYSGSWGTLRGIAFSTQHFVGEEAARRYCLDNTSKWDTALAVRYTHISKTLEKAPTFSGKLGSSPYGNSAFITTWQRSEPVVIYADQLTPEERNRLSSLYMFEQTAHRTYQDARVALDRMIENIRNKGIGKDDVDLDSIPTLREKYFSTKEAAQQAKRDFDEYHKTLIDKLYVYTEQSEERWMIAGWAAS